MEKSYKLSQVAEILGCSYFYVNALGANGKLKVNKEKGKRYFVYESDLRAYILQKNPGIISILQTEFEALQKEKRAEDEKERAIKKAEAEMDVVLDRAKIPEKMKGVFKFSELLAPEQKDELEEIKEELPEEMARVEEQILPDIPKNIQSVEQAVMENATMENATERKTFTTSWVQLAAVLSYFKCEMIEVKKLTPNKLTFTFASDENLENILTLWNERKLSVKDIRGYLDIMFLTRQKLYEYTNV